MKRKSLILVVSVGLLVLVIAASIMYTLNDNRDVAANINSFDECVAAGYPVQETFPERCMVTGGKSFTKSVPQGKEVSLEGKVVCLPHKNSNGVQTLECAIGLKTDDGTYYALKSEQTDGPASQAAGSDRRVRVTGLLEEETGTAYPTKGRINITEFLYVKDS